jgi:hypothetical protein
VIVLWLLLSALVLIVSSAGGVPAFARGAALLLLLASGAAAFAAVNLAARTPGSGRPWPLIVPVGAPLVIAAWLCWQVMPAVRQAISPKAASGMAGLALLALSIAPWPLVRTRARARAAEMSRDAAANDSARVAQETADRIAVAARFDRLTTATPLWNWLEFLRADSTVRAAALEGIRTLPSRQHDAESRLAGHAWSVIYELPQLSLEATPAVCEGARQFLREAAGKFVAPGTDGPGRTLDFHRVDLYLPALQWLVAHDCDVEAERARIEAGVRSYPPSDERDRLLVALARARRAS